MYNITLDNFEVLADDYAITQSEADTIIQQLQTKSQDKTIKDMLQSKNRDKFANKLLTPLFKKTIKSRKKVTIPNETQVRESLSDQLSDVIYIH